MTGGRPLIGALCAALLLVACALAGCGGDATETQAQEEQAASTQI